MASLNDALTLSDSCTAVMACAFCGAKVVTGTPHDCEGKRKAEEEQREQTSAQGE